MPEQDSETFDRSAENDLALIRQMMAAGRKRAGINGSHLVLWGALLSATFFAQYASVMKWIPTLNMELWVTMTVVGWVGSFYLGHKNGRSTEENNPTLIAYSSAWFAVGLTMLLFLLATLFSGNNVGPAASTMLSSGVIGAAFFVMAMVLKIRPMFLAAAGWWAIMVYVITADQIHVEILILLSAAAALLILLPGLYLQRLAQIEE